MYTGYCGICIARGGQHCGGKGSASIDSVLAQAGVDGKLTGEHPSGSYGKILQRHAVGATDIKISEYRTREFGKIFRSHQHTCAVTVVQRGQIQNIQPFMQCRSAVCPNRYAITVSIELEGNLHRVDESDTGGVPRLLSVANDYERTPLMHYHIIDRIAQERRHGIEDDRLEFVPVRIVTAEEHYPRARQAFGKATSCQCSSTTCPDDRDDNGLHLSLGGQDRRRF
ncbi:hypothetical protein SAMN05660666_00104 [Novosphingobium aromaticivorans]|nr:hypothetical protein SAMN05660666_00104 [Novosphingobium aromaticivorans]